MHEYFIYNYNSLKKECLSLKKKDSESIHVIFILCLSVFLYPINVQTAKPIGLNLFAGSRVTPESEFNEPTIFESRLKFKPRIKFFKFGL